MASKSGHPKANPNPGLALRALRKRRGWTLADVSAHTGLPVSTLSKIENGKMSLTYDKLVRLSTGFETDIAQLLETDESAPHSPVNGRRSVTRAGEGLAIDTENYGHLYSAADLLNKQFIPIVAELRARSLEEFGALVRHPGEEYAYVLEGTVDLHTDLYAPIRLELGDSIYFDSGMGHAYVAASPGRCRVLSICSATQTQLLEASGADRAAPAASAAKAYDSGGKPVVRRGKPARGRKK